MIHYQWCRLYIYIYIYIYIIFIFFILGAITHILWTKCQYYNWTRPYRYLQDSLYEVNISYARCVGIGGSIFQH